MNKLFIGNGILLMVLMGFQQWFTCYTGFSRGVSVDLFGEKIFLEVLQVEIVKRLPFVFAAIALVSPFIMIRRKRLSSQTKTEFERTVRKSASRKIAEIAVKASHF
jgi:hypothetical protein